MNVVKIMGGLGNQLFQYAIGKHLEQFDSIGYDVSYYESSINKDGSVPHREFLLPLFVKGLIFEEQGGRERVNQWEYDHNKTYVNKYFFGDWQKANFFKDVDLGIELKEKHIDKNAKETLKEILNNNSVAIHVRRTDYANFGWMLQRDYYLKAIDEICSREEKPIFYIFTDDVQWCKDHLTAQIVHYDEITDFYLMSHCKHQIIANSTFSFWAAYLNDNENKKVVYPENWLCTSNPCEGLPWIGI